MYLYKTKKITRQSLLTVRRPLRTFCGNVIDACEMPFTYSSNNIITPGTALRSTIEKLLKPYIAEKGMTKVAEVMDYFLDEATVDDFFTRRKWKETKIVGEVLRRLWDARKI